MKVLMTGHTTFQCKMDRPVNRLYSGATAIQYALAGEDVTNCSPWEAMPHLGDYDVIMCGLYAMASIASRHGEACAYMIHLAREQRIPIVFYLDDWHLNLIKSGYRNLSMPDKAYMLERHARLLNKDKDGVRLKVLLDHIKPIQETIRKLYTGEDSNFRILIPMLGWCQAPLMTNVTTHFPWREQSIVLYDPTNLFPSVRSTGLYPPSLKRRSWVLSSRYDQTKFVDYLKVRGMRWPVEGYGFKKNGDTIIANELDLVAEAYEPSWGILSHAYPISLQGQWRNRFTFATQARSVIYCEGVEAGPGLVPSGGIRDIEAMTVGELANLVLRQREWMADNTWSASMARDAVRSAIEAVRG